MAIKLVIFDIDGTIYQTYSWQYVHESLGTWKKAKKYNDLFFANRINYQQWAELDAALWKGQPTEKIGEIICQMPYTEGAKEALLALRQNGLKIYLLSAGLTRVAERINDEIGVDGFSANTLTAQNGVLTGDVDVKVPFHSKDSHLSSILQRFPCALKDCAAVGDDPTMISLFIKVGLSIAFNPSNNEVEEHADITIRGKPLTAILPYILSKSACTL